MSPLVVREMISQVPCAPPCEVTVDEALAPIKVVRFGSRLSRDAYDRYEARADRWLDAGQPPFLLVLDSREVGYVEQSVIHRGIAWLSMSSAALRARCLGSVFVVETGYSRFALSTVFLAAPYPAPHHVCVTLPEAYAWARSQLQQAGVSVPPGLENPR